jgi:uncharacterized Zn finger protein
VSPRRTFGHTWWGLAWVDALENRARLDPNRLPRGRTYARHDRVLRMATAPGEITATVAGNRPSPYSVRIRVRTFTDDEWDAVVDAICARAAHAAALLDGELDPGLVDDARSAGLEVLPGPGDLQPRCSCPDWADPCKHAAAVCYLVADALDDDPFALFALRGRGREQLLAAVRRRRSATGADTGGAATGAGGGDGPVPWDLDGPTDDRVDVGVVARDAWRHEPGSLPGLAPLRDRPGTPAPWPLDPPGDAPFTAPGLRALAADAAARALAMMRDEAPSGLGGDVDEDLCRRAADALGTDAWPALARAARTHAGIGERELVGRALAWQVAGAEGLAARDEPAWTPDPLRMAAARDAVVSTGVPARQVAVRTNRVTVSDQQFRLARDGRWWRFAKRAGRWELDAGPAEDIDDLMV